MNTTYVQKLTKIISEGLFIFFLYKLNFLLTIPITFDLVAFFIDEEIIEKAF